MCYNNPPVYRVDITPEMFEDLADVETIVCIKEAAGDTRRITDLFNKLGERYIIFSGLDDVALESIMPGLQRLDFRARRRLPPGESHDVGCRHRRRLATRP